MTETTIWDIGEHRGEPPAIRVLSFRESFYHLDDYLSGGDMLETRPRIPGVSGGNPLITRSVEGIYVCGFLNALRFHPDSPLVGHGIRRVWDEDGHLFLTVARDGESLTVEVRQLTDKGVERLDDLAGAVNVPPHWVSPVNRLYTSGDAMWDGVFDLWRDPVMAAAPDYAARSTYLPKVRLSASRLAESALTAAADDPTLPGLDPADPTGLSMGGADAAATTL